MHIHAGSQGCYERPGVHIAGTGGVEFMPQNAHGTAKAGVINLTQQLAVEGGPHQIRVVCVSPGFTVTPSTAWLVESGPQPFKDNLARIPLGRPGQPADIVNAALWHVPLEAVAEMADWKRKRRNGRALGLAFGDYHGTVTAGVVEISLDRKTGQVKVHDLWIAVDPGLAVQPQNVLAQLEGAAVWGLSVSLKEQVTVKGGAAVQSNFHDYPVLRMSEMPQIHTRLVKSDAPPTGMGEAGVVSVAPAIANALFALTGKRVRNLPMTPDTVRKVIA